jgi:N-acetylglucosaminyldiphosphoundecaprenol N-acetyl-beta-D-mannosaminyltransferase
MAPTQDNSHASAQSLPFSAGISQRSGPVGPAQPAYDSQGGCPKPERTEVWDVPFDRVTLQQAIEHIEHLIARGQPSYVITANVNYVMLHHRRPDVQPITKSADLILADGQPIVWRSKLASNPLPQRVAGSELIFALAEQASLKGWKIYFLGGQPGVAGTCAERLAQLYPGLSIAGVEAPPFRELSPDEQAAQDARIRSSGADLLLVALGQPKGEAWIYQHYQRLGVPVSIQLGASFDFIAGTAARAPLAWQRCGMEWAFRMLSDPGRLVPRYTSNALFLCSALIEDWKRKVTSWGMGQWSTHR